VSPVINAPVSRPWINIALYLGTTAVTSVLGMVTALLMAHLLPPEQYGRIGIFLSVLYIGVPAVSMAAEGLIAVNRSRLDDEEYNRFRRTTVAIGISMFVALQTLGILLWLFGALPDWLLLVVPGFALLRLATTMSATEYIVEQNAIRYSILTVLNSMAALALTYGLMTWVSASAGARVAALMLAELVLLVGRYHGKMGLLLRPAFDEKYKKQIVKFGIPSLFALFGAWGLNESDKISVSHGAGLEVAGIYTAAAALAVVMMNFNQSLTNALFPGLFSRLAAGNESVVALMKEHILKFVGLNAAFALLVALGYALVKDLWLPAKYASASSYFYALVLANLAVALFRPLSLTTEYYKMARLRAVAVITGGVVTILCATIGIHWSGSALWAPAGIASGYLVGAIILALGIYGSRANEI
jgi:O-antigen/teichoic acid export membrane protein